MREVVLGEVDVAAHDVKGLSGIVRDGGPVLVVGLTSKYDDDGAVGCEDYSASSGGRTKPGDNGFGVDKV